MSNYNIWYPKIDHGSIKGIANSIDANRRKLFELPTSIIVDMLAQLSTEIILSDLPNKFEGLTFFAQWLRRENLHQLYKRDLGDEKVLDSFIQREGQKVFAQPRGVVCHWVASNVGTLALFSLIQMLLCKNANLLKVPEESVELIISILKIIEELEVEHKGATISGRIITNTIGVVSFSSSEKAVGEEFSLCADLRIVWGSRLAAQGIESLSSKDHAETLVFGPKYSMGMYDKETIKSNNFRTMLSKSVQDIITFNQMACSSPHVYFFEKTETIHNRDWIIEQFKLAFKDIESKKNLLPHQPGISAGVINARAKHFLEPSSDVVAPKSLSWTILANDSSLLEDPVYGRTIYVKEIDDLKKVYPLVNRNIQCVSMGIQDEKKREFFAKELSYRGVDRCVQPGQMHLFDFPWDGIFPLGRAVRWISLK